MTREQNRWISIPVNPVEHPLLADYLKTSVILVQEASERGIPRSQINQAKLAREALVIGFPHVIEQYISMLYPMPSIPHILNIPLLDISPE